MTEPTTTPAALDPSAMTLAQAAAELATAQDNPALYDPTHPEYAAATARMNALTQRRQGGPASSGEPGPPLPDETPPRPNVFEDPQADPTTAILDQVPPPELSPAAVKAGFQWDSGKLRAVNALAEREGVTGFVLEGRYVVAEALSGPPVDAVTAERQLHQRWGSGFPSKLEAAHLAFDALPSDVRADLERRELDVHPAVMDYLARVGQALMDASTPGGERRLRAKYADKTGGAR